MVTNSTEIRPKVAAALTAGSVVTAVVLVLGLFGVVVPEDVSTAAITAVAAITTVASFIAGYFRSDAP